MINFLIDWALRRRLPVLMLAGLLVGWGAWTTVRMPVDVLPDLTAPTVTILVEGHGMAPEEMESLVTFPIETAVNGASQVRRVRSATALGIAVVWVEFEWGADEYRARQTVTERLATVADSLPEQVDAPMLAPITSIMGDVMFAGLTSDRHGPMELRRVADEQLERRLRAVPGVAQVIALGGEVRQYQVVLAPERLLALDVSVGEVEAALRHASENTSAGILVEGGVETIVRGIGRFETLDEIAATEVARRPGRAITIGDLGIVRIGPKLRRGVGSVATRGPDGAPNIREGVVIAVRKQPEANTLELTERLDEVLADVEATLPEGMKIHGGLFRQADFIEAAIDNTTVALLEGALFVVLVVVVFLASIRASLITLVALPVSLLAAVLALSLAGAGINTMTLGGMAIAIGSLVDDAIIDVENVVRRLRENRRRARERRKPFLRTIYEASVEVRPSIVLATVIILLVFAPLFFLSGVEGRLLRPLGIAFSVALAASLVTALTLTPALCALLLRKEEEQPDDEEHEPRVVTWLKRGYARPLRFAMRRPWLVLTPTLILFVLAVVGVARMGKNFLPEFNEGSLVINLVTAPGTALEHSNQLGAMAEEVLMQHPEVRSIARRTGRAEADEHVQGVEASQLEVRLDMEAPAEMGLPVRSKAELLEALRADLGTVPGVQVVFGQPISHRIDHMLSGTAANVAVKIFGEELPVLRQLAGRVETVMGEVPGVVDLTTEQQVEVPQLRVEFDRAALARYGVSREDAARVLAAAHAGHEVGQVLEGQFAYDLTVRYAAADQVVAGEALPTPTRAEVGGLLVATAGGGSVPLRELARIRDDLGPNLIGREDVQRKIVVSCNVAGRAMQEVVEEIDARVREQVDFPTGYWVEYGGQFETAAATNQRLAVLGIAVVLGIAGLLQLMFRRLRDVALIMVNLPLALIGGVAGVALSGGILSVASIIGFVSVFGIAARNGIMLVSHVRHLQAAEGVRDFAEAVRRGAMERLAPILMTALSAGLALVPLALRGDDPGTEILTPMAIVILWGLLSSTFLNMLVVPALFVRYGRPVEAAAGGGEA